jgi:hypothetical protein
MSDIEKDEWGTEEDFDPKKIPSAILDDEPLVEEEEDEEDELADEDEEDEIL